MEVRETRMPVYRLIRTRPLFLAAVLFTGGCFLASRCRIPTAAAAVPGGIALLCFGIFLIRKKKCALAFLMAAMLFAGAVRYGLSAEIPAVDRAYDAAVAGIAVSDAVYQPEKERTLIEIGDVSVNGDTHPGKMRVYIDGEVSCLAGDLVSMTAYVWQPEPSNNPGAYDFRFDLWSDGITACAKTDLVEVTGHRSSLNTRLCGIRRGLSDRIDRLMPKNAGLMKSLLLADKTELAASTRDAFSATGTAHLLAVSGLHVTAVAALTEIVLLILPLPAYAVFALTMLLLLLYAHVIGCPAPVMRAVIMYAYMRLGKLTGHGSDPFTRLGAAALILLLIDPMLIAGMSFQMSFLCVFVLLCLTRTATALLGEAKLRPGKKVRDALAVGGCGFLAQLPIASNVFGVIAPFGILVNLPAVPLGIIGLYGGIIALFIGCVWAAPARLAGRAADFILTLLVKLVTKAGSLPFAAFGVPGWPWYALVLFIAMIAALSPLSGFGKKARRVCACLLCAAVLMPFGASLLPGAPLKAVFLNVEQANCAVVSVGRDLYLTDTGEDSYAVTSYLSSRAGKLKGVFLTHAHRDHMGALTEVIEGWKPETVYLPENWNVYGDLDEGMAEKIAAAEAAGTRFVTLKKGDELRLSDHVTARVYAPDAQLEYGDANDGSLVIGFHPDTGGGILFAGDVSAWAEPDELPDIDVLAAAHHGADTSTTDRLLRQTTPGAAVISVGYNRFGHPGEALLERLSAFGIRVFRTDRDGAVTAVYKNDGRLYLCGEAGGSD